MDTTTTPHPIDRLEACATLARTPCGDGEMVWRCFGEGEPLVLLHGGYGSWLHWFHNVEALAARRRVVCADLPGLGDSAEPPAPYSAQSIAAIVLAGLDRVIGEGAAFDLAGFSFGGHVGGHVAAMAGARARRLVLIGAGAMGLRRARYPALTRAEPHMSEDEQRAIHRRNLALFMLADPARVDDVAVEIQLRNVRRARTKSRPLNRTDALRHLMARSDARLAGIWGEHDVTAAPYLDERAALFESVQPGCRFEVVPGTGHWVMYEAPERVNDLLGQMLEA